MGMLEDMEKRLDVLAGHVVHLRQDVVPELDRRLKALEASHHDVRYGPATEIAVHRDAERPRPQMMVCPIIHECLDYDNSGCHWEHVGPHARNKDCATHCFRGYCCIPMPAAQEAKATIPDVPVAVGTEAFRIAFRGHVQELTGQYAHIAQYVLLYDSGIAVTLERLADAACTLRDAYDLASSGKHQEAMEKLKEIEW